MTEMASELRENGISKSQEEISQTILTHVDHMEDDVIWEGVKVKKYRLGWDEIETTVEFRTISEDPEIIRQRDQLYNHLAVFFGQLRHETLKMLEEDKEAKIYGPESDPNSAVLLAKSLVDRRTEALLEYDLNEGNKDNLSNQLKNLRSRVRGLPGAESEEEPPPETREPRKLVEQAAILKPLLDALRQLLVEAQPPVKQAAKANIVSEEVVLLDNFLNVTPERIDRLRPILERAEEDGGKLDKETIIELEIRNREVLSAMQIMEEQIQNKVLGRVPEPAQKLEKPLEETIIQSELLQREAQRCKGSWFPEEARQPMWAQLQALRQEMADCVVRAKRLKTKDPRDEEEETCPVEQQPEIVEWKKVTETLEYELNAKREEIKDLNEKVEAKDRDNNEMSKQLKELEDQECQVEADRADRQREKKDLEEQLEKLRPTKEQEKELEEGLAALIQRHNEILPDYEKAQKRRKDVDAEATKAEREMEEEKQKGADLAEALKRSMEEVKRKRDALDTMDKEMKDNAERWAKEDEERAAAIAAKEKELRELQRQTSELDQKLEAERQGIIRMGDSRLPEREEELRQLNSNYERAKRVWDPVNRAHTPDAVNRFVSMVRNPNDLSGSSHIRCCVKESTMQVMEEVKIQVSEVAAKTTPGKGQRKPLIQIKQTDQVFVEGGRDTLVFPDHKSAPLQQKLTEWFNESLRIEQACQTKANADALIQKNADFRRLVEEAKKDLIKNGTPIIAGPLPTSP